MSPALAPRLTKLDERVLAALADGPLRASGVAKVVHGRPYWHCDACGREVPVSDRNNRHWKNGAAIQCLGCLERLGWDSAVAGQTLRPVRVITPERAREVAEVLRGLERTGYAVQAGGWWRQA